MSNILSPSRGAFVFALAVVFLIAGCGRTPTAEPPDSLNVNKVMGEQTITVYSSPSCSCCGRYVDYLKREGIDVESIRVSNEKLYRLKIKQGIPRDAHSCHTAIVGDYFVEGHVPLEAVAWLVKQQPDVAGISIPGMIQNTPGMGYPMGKQFTVYSINAAGEIAEFTSVTY